jgi:hypothetical protein
MKPTNEDVGQILNEQVAFAISKIAEKYPCESLETMGSALESGVMADYGWGLPSMPYHITSSLINGKATTKTKKSIEEFKIGIEEKMDINCILIVENLFVVTLLKPKFVEVDAHIPYMGLWMNGAKPKDVAKFLDFLLYTIKPSIKHGEERLRSYYSIMDKSKLKDDVVGEIKVIFDKYKTRKVWFCFIKDSEKIGFESFIKPLEK